MSGADAFELADAREADADRLAELASTTFREAYAHVHGAEDLDAYCAEHYAPAHWRRTLTAPDHRVTLARDAAGDAAFLVVVDRRAPEAPDLRAVELKQVYLRQRAAGSGLARRLLALATSQAQGLGADHLWLVVADSNMRARRFYDREGFRPLGEGPVLVVGRERLTSRTLLRHHGPAER